MTGHGISGFVSGHIVKVVGLDASYISDLYLIGGYTTYNFKSIYGHKTATSIYITDPKVPPLVFESALPYANALNSSVN